MSKLKKFRIKLFNVTVEPGNEYEVSIVKLDVNTFENKSLLSVSVTKIRVEINLLFFALRVNR